MKEKKARVEDALHATRAAIEEGVVPGGGVALIRCLAKLEKSDLAESEKLAVDILPQGSDRAGQADRAECRRRRQRDCGSDQEGEGRCWFQRSEP